jgi:hypothetical protein
LTAPADQRRRDEYKSIRTRRPLTARSPTTHRPKIIRSPRPHGASRNLEGTYLSASRVRVGATFL